MVRLLLEKGADIESRDIRGTTLLSRVAFGDGTDSEAIVNLLIERSADIEARDNEGLTPLAVAVKHRRLELVSIFFGEGQQWANSTFMGRMVGL